MNPYPEQPSDKDENSEKSVCYEFISEQNKERRQIQFSPEVKESFDADYDIVEEEQRPEPTTRDRIEEVLPIGELTKQEENGLGKAFNDLFCCGGCSAIA